MTTHDSRLTTYRLWRLIPAWCALGAAAIAVIAILAHGQQAPPVPTHARLDRVSWSRERASELRWSINEGTVDQAGEYVPGVNEQCSLDLDAGAVECGLDGAAAPHAPTAIPEDDREQMRLLAMTLFENLYAATFWSDDGQEQQPAALRGSSVPPASRRLCCRLAGETALP